MKKIVIVGGGASGMMAAIAAAKENPTAKIRILERKDLPGKKILSTGNGRDVYKRQRYDSAFTFIYSKRTGTPAAAMEDQIPADVVKDRFDRLLSEVQSIASEVCAVHEGKDTEVLVESVSDHDRCV